MKRWLAPPEGPGGDDDEAEEEWALGAEGDEDDGQIGEGDMGEQWTWTRFSIRGVWKAVWGG